MAGNRMKNHPPAESLKSKVSIWQKGRQESKQGRTPAAIPMQSIDGRAGAGPLTSGTHDNPGRGARMSCSRACEDGRTGRARPPIIIARCRYLNFLFPIIYFVYLFIITTPLHLRLDDPDKSVY
jgi:hypothetical protein